MPSPPAVAEVRRAALAIHRGEDKGRQDAPPWAALLHGAYEEDEGARAAAYDALVAIGLSAASARFAVELARRSTIVVATDGSGDHREVGPGIDAVASGGTVCVLAGTYAIANWGTDRPMLLLGEGIDETLLKGDPASGAVLAAAFDVRFEIAQLTVEVDGEGNGVTANVGELVARDCRFTHARCVGSGQGIGVLVRERGKARITDCRFDDNESAGTIALDEGSLIVEGSRSDKTRVGFGFCDRATGEVRRCRASECETAVGVEDEASVVVEDNEIDRCSAAGITIASSRKTVARRNRISGCTVAGIYARRRAVADLSENRCDENGRFGIAFAEDASGDAVKNSCVKNGKSGLCAVANARVTIVDNTVAGHSEAGILFTGSATGTARNNECRDNEVGILVAGNAEAHLEANRCRENGDGIVYMESARGRVEKNYCQASRRSGIRVVSATDKLVDHNECDKNAEAGITIGGAATGMFKANTCAENHFGILVVGEARPEVEENVCRHNVMAGLAYGGSAAGAARRNKLPDNGRHPLLIQDQALPELREND